MSEFVNLVKKYTKTQKDYETVEQKYAKLKRELEKLEEKMGVLDSDIQELEEDIYACDEMTESGNKLGKISLYDMVEEYARINSKDPKKVKITLECCIGELSEKDMKSKSVNESDQSSLCTYVMKQLKAKLSKLPNDGIHGPIITVYVDNNYFAEMYVFKNNTELIDLLKNRLFDHCSLFYKGNKSYAIFSAEYRGIKNRLLQQFLKREIDWSVDSIVCGGFETLASLLAAKEQNSEVD